MTDRLTKLAGPHGGGYLLLALLLIGFPVAAFLLYLFAFSVMTIWGFYEMGLGWLW